MLTNTLHNIWSVASDIFTKIGRFLIFWSIDFGDLEANATKKYFDFTPLCILIKKGEGEKVEHQRLTQMEKTKVDYLFAEKKSTIGHEDDFSIFYWTHS